VRKPFIIVLLGLLSLHVKSEELDPASVVSIRLERSACYGTCPVYSVAASRVGTLLYSGTEHVKVRGARASKIDERDFAFLATAASHIHFMSLRDRYASETDGCKEVWTDNPSVKIALQLAGRSKTVSYYMGCRGLAEASRISWFADTIDEMAHSSQWVRER
jgi:hypothetical protein